ncbi:MAG: TetR/AcrR family transcriptional regulator [Thermotogae bacterium]|nr:TetR/AcrR family transcriptional regulator [Thermotogota bacterium]
MRRTYIKKSVEKKIDNLILNARNDILENGISKFNFDRIIHVSGISKATVYKKYGNKKNFIKIVIKDFMDELVEPFEKFLESIYTLEDIFNFMYNFKNDILFLIKVYPVNDFFSNDEMNHYMAEYYNEIFKKIIIIKIIELQKNGQIRKDIMPEYIFYFVTSITRDMASLVIKKDYDEVIKNYSVLLKHSLKP